MGYLKYVKQLWKKPRETLGQRYRDMLTAWRAENRIVRVERPTRIDRARSLGYKSKQGFVVVRVRVRRGRKENPTIRKGRAGGNKTRKLVQSKNYRQISEEKAQKKFPNLEVLNSYWIGQDERYYFNEVILVDPYHSQIQADKDINWVVSNKHTRRVYRGRTSAGRKSRGLHKKGKGTEKVRPSLRANNRRLR
jgi:large subunit ribosomal protein L15e